jgi:Arc/MetJ-type ribon-helix-helix transcriptional regulator
MKQSLSPIAESYIARAVADGKYPSREAVLEAAVAALRERDGDAEASDTDSYSTVEMTPEECERLQREALHKSGRDESTSSGFTIPEQR